MRVLSVIDSLAVGGAERSLSAVAPHLVKRGIDLHIAHLVDRADLSGEMRAAGAEVHSLDGPGGRLRAYQRTVTLTRALQPDVVHTTLFESDVVGRAAGGTLRKPVVSSFVTESYGTEHLNNPEYRRWKVRAAQALDAASARFVTRFHAVSSSSADVMARRLRVRRDKIEVIPRGRDPVQLGRRTEGRSEAARKALGVAPSVPIVLAVGRHYHFKGLDILVRGFPEVVRRVPDVQLVIVGREGPATPELRRLIDVGGIGNSVTLAGYRSDIPELLSAADVFVLPSRAEGSPGALIEAMALEAPTVASDIPSVDEVAGSGPETVLLVPLDSSGSMADAIVALLNDRSRAQVLAAAGRRRFLDRYTIGTVADATADLYWRCASRG